MTVPERREVGGALTTLTLVVIATIIAGAFTRLNYARALAIGGATPIGAALVAGPVVVPTFYAVAIGALVGIGIRGIRRARSDDRVRLAPIPGGATLLGFTGWSVAVTLVASLLFAGVVVYYPTSTPGPLAYGVVTLPNIAQIGYLTLSVAVVFFIARSKADPTVLGLAVTIVTLLSFWRFLSVTFGLPFPEGLFDNSPAFKLIETGPGGVHRFRGILSEPAGLAATSLVAIAYMGSRAVRTRGWHRVGVILVLAMAALMASLSTSATFVVALVVVAGLAIAAGLVRVVRLKPISPVVLGFVVAAGIASYWVVPLLVNSVTGVVNAKVGSSSYDARSNVDGVSYEILFQTFGIGVGLGSHRPSSFLAALFSTTGIPGALLFIATVLLVIRAGLRNDAYRPVIWGLVALLTTKIIGGPDLADTSGLLWISIGLLAQSGVVTARPAEVPGLAPPMRGLDARGPSARGAGVRARRSAPA